MPKVPELIFVRPPWERILRLHEEIKAGNHPNASGIAELFSVSTRTILRDLDFMRYRLDLPIAYDAKRYGFVYTRPVDQFPSVAVTEAEMFALLVAHKAVVQYQGTAFYQPLEAAFHKLLGHLDQTTRFTMGSLDKALSFQPFALEDTDLGVFRILLKGLQEHLAVKFKYKNLGAAVFKRRLVHPYHLACIENRWYLFAFDVKRQDLRTFALTRLREAQLTGKPFEPPKQFDLEEHLRGSFRVYKGSGDFEVVIEFDAWATDLVRGRQWHATQQWSELPEGRSRLRMRLGSVKEVEGWVLSWGAHATVVQPPALIERIQKTVAELQRRYGY